MQAMGPICKNQKTMTVAVKRRHLTIRRWLREVHSGIILNVGCGTLRLPGHSERWRVVNLEVARRPFPNLVLYDGSIFPFQDNSFDAVLCLDVLEHVPNDSLMLSEIARVLKPDGMLVLTTPSIEHDFRELRMPLGNRAKEWSQAEQHWGHVRSGYSIGELVCLCHEAGLKVVAVEKYAATLAHVVFQLWYLGGLSWLFSWRLVLPRLLMELALRLDYLLWRNRGCAIALKAVGARE